MPRRTVPKPTLPGAPAPGAMKWEDGQGPDDWTGADGSGPLAKIRASDPRNRVTEKTTFYCYRRGRYLGREATLDDAKRLCEVGDRKSQAAFDELPSGLPADLSLTSEERKATRDQKS